MVPIFDCPQPSAELEAQVALIARCHARLLGRPLAALSGKNLWRDIWEAPYVVVSHGTEEDPLFNFANSSALRLWEMSWEEFIGLPSRYSAELAARQEREQLLSDVRKQGYSENYSGVRASRSGRRFRLEGATVFNLSEGGNHRGQAAVFSEWTFL